MYRIIQFFKPGEVTPEEANRIGYELAMRFTGGHHQFVVATHVDKAHIHTHIEFNSTNLDCDGKFNNVKGSSFILRRLNDELCKAHGLSVIEHPQKKGKHLGEAAAVKYSVSFKEKLRQTIDRVLMVSSGFEDFLEQMQAEGYEVKRGKHLAFRAPGQERFTRSHRLGDAYTMDALRERSESRRSYAAAKKVPLRDRRNINLLIDIQAKLDDGKVIQGIQFNGEEVTQHEAAQKAFDALGGKPILKVAQLSREYAALLAEKQAVYETYKVCRQEMIDLRTAKQNMERILGLSQQTEQVLEESR